MKKLIVYLDQNFVSNLAKAKAGTLKDEGWLYLYDVLFDLIHKEQKVVCPESIFHQTESSLSQELVPAINKVVIRLSWGLQLIPWEVALRAQVRRAMCRFLGKKEDPPHWSEAFTHDPDSVVFGGGQCLGHVPWRRNPEFIESDERIKERYPALMAEVKKAVAGKDFASQVEQEKRAFVDYHYITPSQKALEAFLSDRVPRTLMDCGVFLGGSEWFILQGMWEDLGGEKARLKDFLASEYFKTCPFVDIQSRLYAALLVFDPDRTPKAGDYYDTQIIATAMPHCDVLAVDSYMKHLVEQIGLDKKYRVHMFSAKQEDLERFLAFLRELSEHG